ncbi:MAG: glycosyltransferase family 39 protein [Burkholderiales bacterium]
MSEQTLGSTAGELPPPVHSAQSKRSMAWLALLLVLFALLWFASLGSRSLVDTDEGRYAALALEMARSGDWVTPRLNGLLYFEKPPLQYWIGALSFNWFGITEFSARLWTGLAGFLTVLAVGCTAARLWGRTSGLQAFAVAASSTWIIGVSHVLTLDAGLSLFTTLTLCAVLLAECAQLAPPARRRFIWAAWIATAFAVLSKGPVGFVIPAGALLLSSLWMRDFALLRRMRLGTGLVMLLVVAAPWFVLVSLRNPGFAEFFFIHEHVARYMTEVHHRVGAWWYYLPLLLIGMMPWTSALPWIAQRDQPAADSDTRAVRMLAAWCGFVLVFFSLSGSKLPSYILPMFPALALLVALKLRGADTSVLRRHLLVPTVAWAVALIASTQLHRFGSAETPKAVMVTQGFGLGVAAVLFLAGASTAFWCLARRHVTAAVLSVALGHFAAMTVVIQAYDAIGQLKSADALSRVVLPLMGPDTPVFAVRVYDQTLPFYLRRNAELVEFVGEFEFGQQHEPGKSPATLDEFIARWQTLPQGVAYMRSTTFRELLERGVPMRVVFEDPRRLVVMKP